jgi:AmiR/NasT family two-component response regulator
MMTENQLIGVIDFYTPQPHKFTERDKHVLSVVADAAARAIANTESMIKSPVIREELESRKLIEQAKAILVAQRGLNGAGAHRWIQERSMATQKSAREVAAAVLLTEETPLSVPF